MSNLLKYTKRVWTAVLASALILTSVPYNVYADEPDNTSEPEIVEVVDDVEPAAEGADGDVLLEDAAKSEVTFALENVTVPDSGHTAIINEGDKWYVEQEDSEGSKVNKSEIKVKLTASDHYTLTGTGASVSATVNGADAYVSEPADGVYTIKKASDSAEALDGGVAITATAVPVTHEVTVTDSTDGKATFTPLDGMEPGEAGKYIIVEKDGYSFTVKTTEKNKVPKVSRKPGEGSASEMTGVLDSETGGYTYTVEASDATTNDVITIELKDDVKYKLTASGNAVVKYATSKTAAESEWAEITSEGVELFKGDTVYYKVTAKDNYRLAGSEAVTIDSVAQTADANGIYTFTMGSEAKQISVDTVATATLTFSLTGVKSLKYSVGSAVTSPESLDLTKNPVTLTVDSGKSVYIRSIEADNGYDMQGTASKGYLAVTVKLGGTSKEYSVDDQYWALGNISSSDSVSVEIKKEKSVVTISDSSNLLKSIKVQEMAWDSSSEEWIVVTDNELGSLVEKEFSEGKIQLTINKNSCLRLSSAEYLGSNAEHAVWNKLIVEKGERRGFKVDGVLFKYPDDKPFQTIEFINSTGTVVLGTGTLEAGSVKLAEGTTGLDGTTPITIEDSSKVTVDGKDYLKRVGGLTFTLNPASGKAIKEVRYSYNYKEPNDDASGTIVKTAEGSLSKIAADKYTLPEEDVQKAIAAGNDITISAVTGSENVTATFQKDSNENAATVKYQEYAITGTGDSKAYTPVGSEVTVSGYDATTGLKSYDMIKNGNILAVTVEPAADQLVLSESVKFNGKAITPESAEAADAIKGKYVITPEEAEDYTGKNLFTVDTKAPVAVTSENLTKPVKGVDKEVATITPGNGVVSGKSTGDKITFTQVIGSTIEAPQDMYVTLGTPVAVYTVGTGESAKSYDLSVTKEEADNTWSISKNEVEKAITEGGAIKISANAKVNSVKTITAATGSQTVSIAVYKDEKASKADSPVAINEKPTFAEGDTFDIPAGGYVKVRSIAGADADTDFALYTVTTGSGDDEKSDKDYAAAGDGYALGEVSDDTTLKVEVKDLNADKIQGVNADLLSDDEYKIYVEVDENALVGTGSGAKIKAGSAAKVYVKASPVGDSVNKYIVNVKKAAVLYVGEDDETGKGITLSFDSENGEYYYAVPAKTLAEAAFATTAGITIAAYGESSGYQTQALTIVSSNGSGDIENPVVISGGSVVDLMGGTYALSYNKAANVKLEPATGFEIVRVGYMTTSAHKKLADKSISDADMFTLEKYQTYRTDVSAAEDGTANVSFDNVTEPMYIYVATKPKYALTLQAVDITVEAAGKNGYETTSDYNFGQALVLRNGADVVDLTDETLYKVTATIPDGDSTKDVKSTVLTIDAPTGIRFSGSNSEVQGKKVTVKITPAAADSPLATYTIVFDNNKAVTTEDVKFAAEGKAIAAYQLGTEVPTPIHKGGNFDSSRVSLLVTDNSNSTIGTVTAKFSSDYNNVIISTKANGDTKGLIGTTVKVKIVEKLSTTVIDTLTVNVVASQVTAGTFTFAAEGEADSIALTFGDTNFYTATDNLYYLVTATATTTPTSFESTITKLIPATYTSYSLDLTDGSSEAYETDAFTYNLTAQLVQTVPGDNGEYVVGKNIAIRTADALTATATTVANGTYPTSMKFVKSSAAPKKIVSTMDKDILLGNVTYVTAGGTDATVKKLKKVVITNKAGNEIVNSADNRDAVYFSNDYIFINPAEVADKGGIGNLSLIAYAVEPKGVDVTVKTAVSIGQGVERMNITAPVRVYRQAGKKATIKPVVGYLNVDGDTIKPAVKTVTWSLVESELDTTPVTVSGVSINAKSGAITVDATAPTTNTTLYVCATATDAAGFIEQNVTAVKEILVTCEANQADKIMLGDLELEEGGSYYSNQLFGALKAYDADMEVVESTFTVKGLTAIKTGKVITGARVTKVGTAAKPLAASVTATAADGSKTKKTVNFTIKTDKDLNYVVTDYAGNVIMSGDKETEEKTGTNSFGYGKYMKLTISGDEGAMVDHKFAVQGAKKVESYPAYDIDADEYQIGTTYVLSPNSDTTTVRINNTELVLTIKNAAIPTKKTASKVATAVTASNKYVTGYNASKNKNTVIEKDAKGAIFNYMAYHNHDDYAAAGSPNTVTYTVNVAKAPYKSGKVLISTDNDWLEGILRNDQNFNSEGKGDYIVDLSGDGQFTINYVDDGDGDFYIPKGSYKFSVTPVEDNDGNYVAAGKTANITVKAAPAPKANVAMNKTSFTGFTSSADVGFKTQTNIVVKSTEVDGKVTYAPSALFGELKGSNNKGNISKFATVFSIAQANSGKLTCIKAPNGYDVDYTNKPSGGIAGYVELKWTNLDGTSGSKFVKVTVKPASKGEIKPVTP